MLGHIVSTCQATKFEKPSDSRRPYFSHSIQYYNACGCLHLAAKSIVIRPGLDLMPIRV